MNSPAGKAFMILFVWASADIEEGQKWLGRISAWNPVAMNTVTAQDMTTFNAITEAMVPKHAYGTVFGLVLYELTPEILDVMAEHAALQPNNPEVILGVHEFRAEAPKPSVDTVFANRCPHFMIEVIPTATTVDQFEKNLAWAQKFYEALKNTDPSNFLPASYPPLTRAADIDLKLYYGSRYNDLKRIKQQYDPANVFKHTVVQL